MVDKKQTRNVLKKQVPTLSEIAKIAGVSRMTASRALNNQPGVSEATREEILRIADEMGYVANPLAQKLSAGKSHIIGAIAQLHTSYTSDLVMGIGSAVRGAGYEMLLYSLPGNDSQPPHSVVSLLQQIADGLIAILPYESGYLEELARFDVPVITIDAQSDDPPFPFVIADSYQGGRLAVRHLAELGHRHIGCIAGDLRLSSARGRLQAYRDMVAQLDLDDDEGLIVGGGFSHKEGFDAAKQLLTLTDIPTGIVAANDTTAFGALAAIREAGLSVPEDISLVGFDDIPLASEMHPTLTTIRQPLHEMGRSAINLLLARIVGLEVPTNRTILPVKLIVRQSTAPPRKPG
jgi:LacI family transcriptional regulator